jgi:hypothetical protein
MVTLTIYGGRLKRDIIEMALEFCGTAGFEFEHTPEEIASTMRLLDVMMAEYPWNTLGYNGAPYGAGLPEEESGLAEQNIAPAFMHLALRKAPNMGAALSPEAKASIARSYSELVSRVAAASMPTMYLAPNSPRGSGRRRLEPFITEAPASEEE